MPAPRRRHVAPARAWRVDARAGRIRQLRPDVNVTGGHKVHYRFDANRKYIGRRKTLKVGNGKEVDPEDALRHVGVLLLGLIEGSVGRREASDWASWTG